MCGICGKLNFDTGDVVNPLLIRKMMNSIRHRGPDDEGVYTNAEVGLGFRRLSIIDVKAGHQPLSNEDGTVWIVFNGEIYNYRELRAYLVNRGHGFKTQTDTEVIVHLYEEFGPGCIEKLRGMFAFAIWDSHNNSLLLARDRVGIKPLYYTLSQESLLFASEIKAILADPEFESKVEHQAIHRFLTFSYLPGEETLLKGVHKLAPGHYLLVEKGRVHIRQYWDLGFSKRSGYRKCEDAEGELSELLSSTVDLHMNADVPVGVLLSGGVDSTAVLSFAVEKTAKPMSTFTVGFSDPSVTDERPYAKLAAERFRSQHREITISPADFAEFLPSYVWHMEEPVCEPPAVALYYVSKLARPYVTVLLSGEGGDEAFAGYTNYRNILWLEQLKNNLPHLKKPAAVGLTALNSALHSSRIAKYIPLVDASFPEYYYSRTSTSFKYGTSGLAMALSDEFGSSFDAEAVAEPVTRLFSRVRDESIVDQMLYIDTKTWLPDDLLIKADKMTMASSLELRVPLLDHRVLEFAASLPANYKVRGTKLKYIFKRALANRVPPEILSRKKVGFPVPYESWIRTNLNEWVSGILLDHETLARGYFRRSAIEALLKENASGGKYSKEVFSLVVLELWHRQFISRKPSDSFVSASLCGSQTAT